MSIRTARIANLTGAEVAALGTAFAELALAALRVWIWPVGRIIARMKHAEGMHPAGAIPDLALMSWAISAVARRLPWRSDCLVQAVAAKNWLRRYGIQADLGIGAARDAGGQFAAHAWIKVGDTIVTGGDISRFARFTGGASPD